jgi:hypothetical protein
MVFTKKRKLKQAIRADFSNSTDRKRQPMQPTMRCRNRQPPYSYRINHAWFAQRPPRAPARGALLFGGPRSSRPAGALHDQSQKKKTLRSSAGLSTLDDFLKEEGTFEESQSIAIKEVLAWQIAQGIWPGKSRITRKGRCRR